MVSPFRSRGLLVAAALLLLGACAASAFAWPGWAKGLFPQGTPTVVRETPMVYSTPTPQVVQPTPVGPMGNCPTDAQMQEAHGFVTRGIKPVFTGGDIPWEGCKWTLQAYGAGVFKDVPLLPDWQYTHTKTDGTVAVYYGAPGLKMDILGATIRYRPYYTNPDNSWVNDGCELLKREVAFGQNRNPSYKTENGNVQCASAPVSGTFMGPSDPTGSTDRFPSRQ